MTGALNIEAARELADTVLEMGIYPGFDCREPWCDCGGPSCASRRRIALGVEFLRLLGDDYGAYPVPESHRQLVCDVAGDVLARMIAWRPCGRAH